MNVVKYILIFLRNVYSSIYEEEGAYYVDMIDVSYVCNTCIGKYFEYNDAVDEYIRREDV